MLEDLPRMDSILHQIEVCKTIPNSMDIVKLHAHVQPCSYSHITDWSGNVIVGIGAEQHKTFVYCNNRFYEAKIEESEGGWHSSGVEPRTALAWAWVRLLVTASLFLFSPHNISIVRQDALSIIFVHWKYTHTVVQYPSYCFLTKTNLRYKLCTDVCFCTAVKGHRACKCRPCSPLPGGQRAWGSVCPCVQCEPIREQLCGSCSCGEWTLMCWWLHQATWLHTSRSCLL